ncbi:MAG TPA: hypothetical protein VGQ59_04645 [Cyclobacteriaceae bacterium]|jgi:hypothetical protein|nr:hypothetical protein [Cyclobacteriaceae bacterium]
MKQRRNTIFHFNTARLIELYNFTIQEVAFSVLFKKKIFLCTNIYYGDIFTWRLPVNVLSMAPLLMSSPEVYVMVFESIDDKAVTSLHQAFCKRKGSIYLGYTQLDMSSAGCTSCYLNNLSNRYFVSGRFLYHIIDPFSEPFYEDHYFNKMLLKTGFESVTNAYRYLAATS